VLPDFLIIGAQRAGTTSLYNYLARHPKVAPAATNEVHYFTLFYDRGDDWYESNFPRSRGWRKRITGEATPYYLFHPDAPERARRLVPDATLIALLRDPVARAFSHYRHERRLGEESLTFDDAIAREAERLSGDPFVDGSHQHFSYVARGRYAEQIRNWWSHYPRERLLILRAEDLFKDPQTVYAAVLGSLGLPAHRLRSYEVFNAGAELDEMPAETKRYLYDYFRPHNAELYELIGRDMGWDV
jgi:hypothetical protein